MKLIIIDSSAVEMHEESKYLQKYPAGHGIIFYVNKCIKEKYAEYDNVRIFNQEDFDKEQIKADAVYLVSCSDDIKFRIPYFFSINAHCFRDNEKQFEYSYFQKAIAPLSGASAVFVNDKRLNRYANWMGLNSYFINRAVNIEDYKFVNKKFLTPKLNIGFFPKGEFYKESHIHKIVEDMWASAKSNWVLQIPSYMRIDWITLNKNVEYMKYDDFYIREKKGKYIYDRGPRGLNKYLSKFYSKCHVVINPENIYKMSHGEMSSEYNVYDAMSTGCVAITSNMHGNNSHIMFDKHHYLKLDYIDSNTLLDTIRYADKRREKLERMSKAGSDLIKKYYNLENIVDEKLRIIESNI